MSNSTTHPETFTCCLIGGDSLLTQCGEILLAAHHEIKCVITDSQAISAWASVHNLAVLPVSSNYASKLQALEYDYLFAITHLALIPDEAVESPTKGAINFHDGPLPEYAGLNTPMWALINGVSEYEISWHVMTTGIDTGDLLVTETVPIAADDTAISLNTKCFTAAIESFPKLVQQLVNDTTNPIPQDLSKRSYFGRATRPEHFSLLDWRKPAETLERLIRGLNTGRYENPLGSPKLLVGDEIYIVESASIRPLDQVASSGEVIEITDDFIRVACADNSLELSRFDNLAGVNVAAKDIPVKVGDNLSAAVQKFDSIESTNLTVAKDEAYWTRQLKKFEPVSLPYSRSSNAKPGVEHPVKYRELSIPANPHVLDPVTVGGAFVTFASRIVGSADVSLALAGGNLSNSSRTCAPLLSAHGVATFTVDQAAGISQAVEEAAHQLEHVLSKQPWLKDLIVRHPTLRSNPMLVGTSALPLGMVIGDDSVLEAELVLRSTEQGSIKIEYRTDAYSEKSIDQLVQHFETWLTAITQKPETAGFEVDLLSPGERSELLHQLNNTSVEYDKSALMQTGFEYLVSQTPDAVAVVANGDEITYQELNNRADRVAAGLRATGTKPETLVGIHVSRSIELLVATIGVLKAGAAYVPLDPAFPRDRIAFMIEDSAMPIIISEKSLQAQLPKVEAEVIEVGELEQRAGDSTEHQSEPLTTSNSLAYVIYTSGSTGKPKGVMLEHQNVVNFFEGMDRVIPGADQADRTWLAVTSLSFDISVLELFWTLNRGFKVVIHDEASNRKTTTAASRMTRVLDMGLFMWGNDDAPGPDKYRLLIEGAKFFDANGFSAVWTPERHFHAFGGPYPNPAVTGAAVATITNNLKIRAGSCVVPLHHPVRIAEEWSVVDNLSNGRVELSAASGWNPNDFVLRPENHADNKKVMYDQLEQVRSLWRGEKLSFDGPFGAVEVESLPRPVQKELPCWITTAGNPETWIEAGRLGLHILTHLLGQTMDEVAEKTAMYRQAREEAGFDPDTGRVALMLHTFVGEDVNEVRELVRSPMKDYLASSMKLAMDYAWSFPAFKRPGGDVSKPEDVDLSTLSEEEVDTILDFAFERYFESSGLFGDVDTCHAMLARCSTAGVNEIACLLDFGVETQAIMDSLPKLKTLREKMVASVEEKLFPADQPSFAALATRHKVTHLQCTPSTARMYLTDSEAREAFSQIDHVLLGGEALPTALAQDVKAVNTGTLTNMYGPTETTIWSLTSPVEDVSKGISIGTPIANTQVYVLDKYRQPLPAGIPGELFIAGDGVARGYLNRPELTEERFVENPFSQTDAKMYATGDLVTFLQDGTLEYLGRTDFQVKVRGYRIELGEIESQLEALDDIAEAAVIVRTEDQEDQRLVAFLVTERQEHIETTELRPLLKQALPDYMVPNDFVVLEFMPRTANGKLDRKALMAIKPAVARKIENDLPPTSELEKTIAELWRKVLKLDEIGLNENFFDLGGHSLLVVQLHNQLKSAIEQPISLTDLYEHTTIKSLSDYLTSGADDRNVKQSVNRGEQRRSRRRRRVS